MGEDEYIFVDNEGCMSRHSSYAEARAAMLEWLGEVEDAATTDGWPEGIGDAVIAKITTRLRQTDFEAHPGDLDEDGISESTGDWWPSDCPSRCNYRMRRSP